MIVDIPLPLAQISKSNAVELSEALAQFYEGKPVMSWFRQVAKETELLIETDAEPWDGLRYCVYSDNEMSQVRLIARLDNLGKGASGAAIQNLNIMCGLPETTGLRL